MAKRGKNQQELADAVGLKRQTIALYESGGASPKLEGFVAIAKYFGVSCDYLLGISRAPSLDGFVQKVVNDYGVEEESLKTLSKLTTMDDKDVLPTLNAMLSNFDLTIGIFMILHNILFDDSGENFKGHFLKNDALHGRIGVYVTLWEAINDLRGRLSVRKRLSDTTNTKRQKTKKTTTKKKGTKNAQH